MYNKRPMMLHYGAWVPGLASPSPRSNISYPLSSFGPRGLNALQLILVFNIISKSPSLVARYSSKPHQSFSAAFSKYPFHSPSSVGSPALKVVAHFGPLASELVPRVRIKQREVRGCERPNEHRSVSSTTAESEGPRMPDTEEYGERN